MLKFFSPLTDIWPMKWLTLILFSTSLLAQDQSPKLDPNKYTVCAITINSDDEKKVFDSQVKKYPNKFNPIVELTHFGKDDWFQKACASNLSCDQLVISGHFAGDFFSENEGGKRLTLKELERASCDKTCDGILKNPLEVFLFGCNTLANKNEDSRTEAEYLQVLLNDGIPLERASVVAASRYSPVGDSNKGSMQRAFAGEKKQLYGFDSIGPSGKNVKGFLQQYFVKTNPVSRLELLEAKRLMEKVDMTNQNLATSLKNTAFTQCEGGDESNPAYKKICQLSDKNVSKANKLALIHDMLGEENYLGYLPVINNFFKENNPQYYLDDEKKELALIAENQVVKGQINNLIKTTTNPGLKNEWASFAKNVGFIQKDEYVRIMKDTVVANMGSKTTDSMYEILCNLDYNLRADLKLKLSDFPDKNFNATAIEALSCLQAEDDAFYPHIDQLSQKSSNRNFILSAAEFYNSANDKEKFKPSNTFISKVKPALASKDTWEREQALEFLGNYAPKDPALHQTLGGMLLSKNPDTVREAVECYSYNIKSEDPAVHRKLTSILRTSSNGDLQMAIVDMFTAQLKKKTPEIVSGLKAALANPKLETEISYEIKRFLAEK